MVHYCEIFAPPAPTHTRARARSCTRSCTCSHRHTQSPLQSSDSHRTQHLLSRPRNATVTQAVTSPQVSASFVSRQSSVGFALPCSLPVTVVARRTDNGPSKSGWFISGFPGNRAGYYQSYIIKKKSGLRPGRFYQSYNYQFSLTLFLPHFEKMPKEACHGYRGGIPMCLIRVSWALAA